jgi:hypothetical protein
MSIASIPGTDGQSVVAVAAVTGSASATAQTTRSEVTSGETVSAADIRSFADIGYTPSTGFITGQSVQQPIANPLHDYESYTYCISLHMLDPTDYNSLIGQDNPVYTPKNVLVSSAGRYGASFVRNSNWREDFYFEELKIKTVINPTARNRNSNLIEIDFTLIEPLGFTLVNRLLATAAEINGNRPGSYIHMPYILQIDFFGTKNGEQINLDNTLTSGPIKGMTKTIPVRLTSVKSKVSQRGTEYQINAVPFNHQAFNQLYVSLPHNTTVTGKTVLDIFGGSFEDNNIDLNFIQKNTEYQAVSREARELRQRANSTAITDEEAQALMTRLSAAQERIQNEFATFGITGYCDAINAWFQDQKKQGIIGQVSAVQVIFDQEIAQNGKLFPTSAPTNVASTPASGSSTTAKKNDLQAASNTAARNKGQIVFDGATINIPAGTTIDRLIDWAVRNSRYIGDQIFDDSVATKIRNGADPTGIARTWINWYKIVPKIRVLTFDPLQNRYALAITFYVKPYKLSAKYPYAPKGRVPGFVKKYDYIFTGKNNDVIDVQLDFNTLYLVELTAAQSKSRTTQTASALSVGKNIDGESKESSPALNPEEPVGQNAFLVQTGVVADNNATFIRPGGETPLSTKAGDLARSITPGARGDMINIDMRIIGDPHFIKQDDVFAGQNLNTIQQQFIQNDVFQSLWMDGGELYVFINFESPVDYDESLGIAPVNSVANKYRYSEFSGVYNIVKVDNIFRNGKFEQSLNLAKLLYDQAGNPIPSASQRIETAINNLQPSSSIPVRFVGPRINLAALATPGSAAALALAAIQNPQGTASTLASLGTSIATQVVGTVVGRLTQQGIDAGIKAVKSVFDTPTFSTRPADYEAFRASELQYGAFGEAPTGAVTGDLTWGIDGSDGLGLEFNLDTSIELGAIGTAADNIEILAALEDLDFIDYGAFF